MNKKTSNQTERFTSALADKTLRLRNVTIDVRPVLLLHDGKDKYIVLAQVPADPPFPVRFSLTAAQLEKLVSAGSCTRRGGGNVQLIENPAKKEQQ